MKTSIPITLLTLVLSCAVPTLAFDQLPPGKWWENDKLVEEINLSSEQQQRIHDMVYEHAMGMIDLNAAVRRAELELGTLVDLPDFKPDEVRRAFANFQSSRQALEHARFEMLLSVREILTTEQWQRMQQLRRQFENNRPGRRGDRWNVPPSGTGNRRPSRPQGGGPNFP